MRDASVFLEAIYAAYGYDLREYAVPSMTRRLQVALAKTGAPDLGALQDRVLADPLAFAAVLGDLTVRVSELFRDPEVFRVVRERVVPVLRTYPLLNVWHAGCATGEEAYSMAMLLQEERLLERTQLYATDLSVPAVERAKEGVFAAEDLAAIVERHARTGAVAPFASHATIAYDRLAVAAALRRRILFFQHDLVSDYAFGSMHVVFCRNVLIYFGRELRLRVLRMLAQSVCVGGFLCLGTSERLPPELAASFVDFAPEAHLYRRREAP
jgi:chemotaxis protein methyltransferase CheR